MLDDVPAGTKLKIYIDSMRLTEDGRITNAIVGNFEKSDTIGVRIHDGIVAFVVPWREINLIEWSES